MLTVKHKNGVELLIDERGGEHKVYYQGTLKTLSDDLTQARKSFGHKVIEVNLPEEDMPPSGFYSRSSLGIQNFGYNGLTGQACPLCNNII